MNNNDDEQIKYQKDFSKFNTPRELIAFNVY